MFGIYTVFSKQLRLLYENSMTKRIFVCGVVIGVLIMQTACYRLYYTPNVLSSAFIRVTNNSNMLVKVRIVSEGFPLGWEKRFSMKPMDTVYQQNKFGVYPFMKNVFVEVAGCDNFVFPNFAQKPASRIFVDIWTSYTGNLQCKVNVEFNDTLLSG